MSRSRKLERAQAKAAEKKERWARLGCQASAATTGLPAATATVDAPVPKGKGRDDDDQAAASREASAVSRLLTRLSWDMALARETRGAAQRAGKAPWDMVLVIVHEDATEARSLFGISPLSEGAEGDGGYIVLETGRFVVQDVMPRLEPGQRALLARRHTKAMRSGGTRFSLCLFVHDDGDMESYGYELPRAERAQTGEETYADETVGASEGFDGA